MHPQPAVAHAWFKKMIAATLLNWEAGEISEEIKAVKKDAGQATEVASKSKVIVEQLPRVHSLQQRSQQQSNLRQ